MRRCLVFVVLLLAAVELLLSTLMSSSSPDDAYVNNNAPDAPMSSEDIRCHQANKVSTIIDNRFLETIRSYSPLSNRWIKLTFLIGGGGGVSFSLLSAS